MLDREKLCKYFTEDQIQDLLELEELCEKIPPGRIRRNRVRKVDPSHIPRPINSFMTYRTEKQSLIRKFCPTANHREISKMVAKWWHNLCFSQKVCYVEQAKNAKVAHTKMYPDYTFRPKPKKMTAKKPVNPKKVNGTPKCKVANVDFLEISQPQHCLTVSGANYCQSPQYPDEQQYFHTNNFYDFTNNNNLLLDQILYGGNHISQTCSYQQPPLAQSIPDSYPVQTSQDLYYGQAVFYYPSPVDKTPSVTLIQTTCNPALISDSNTKVDHAYTTPILDDGITPQSQTMSTPVLGYAASPFVMDANMTGLSSQCSPTNNLISNPSCIYEDFSLYSDINQAVPAVKSNFLQDCDFWGSFLNYTT